MPDSNGFVTSTVDFPVGSAGVTQDDVFHDGGNFFSNFKSWLNNAMTGDLDYKRDLYKMQLQNDYNAAQASISWDRQLNAANTAIQRAAADYRAAGFNPALAMNNSGAGVPSAGVASAGSGGSFKSGGDFLALIGSTLRIANTALVSAIGHIPAFKK